MQRFLIPIHCINLLLEKERHWKKRLSSNRIRELLDNFGNLFLKLLRLWSVFYSYLLINNA